jgi:hypothetical protein
VAEADLRERGREPVVGLDDRDRARQLVDAGLAGLHADRRDRQRQQQAAGDRDGHERAGEHEPHHPRPHAAGAVRAPEPVQQRDARTLDLVAEDREHRRQHGQRAERGDSDDDDRADRHRREDRVARQQQAGHRHHDRDRGHEDGPAAGPRGDLDGVPPTGAYCALVARPADVEQRVVDADRHADEQHDAVQRVGHRPDVRDERGEPDRRSNGREREQDRYAGGEQRAEGDEEDHQGDRQAEPLGPREVVPDRVADGPVDRGVADLLDPQRRVILRHGRGRREQLRHLLVGGVERVDRRRLPDVDGEAHHRRATVGGGDRRVDLRDLGGRLQGTGQVGHRGPYLGRGRPPGARLDEHVLGHGRREAGPLDDAVGLPRLAGAGLRRGQLPGAGHAAGDDGDEDEEQPDAQRPPAVPGAPARECEDVTGDSVGGLVVDGGALDGAGGAGGRLTVEPVSEVERHDGAFRSAGSAAGSPPTTPESS